MKNKLTKRKLSIQKINITKLTDIQKHKVIGGTGDCGFDRTVESGDDDEC